MSDIDFDSLVWRPGWRPSNGTEGRSFEANWCWYCIHDEAARRDDFEHGCPLILRSLSREYVEEWQTATLEHGFIQRCTAFEPDKTMHDPPGAISTDLLLAAGTVGGIDE